MIARLLYFIRDFSLYFILLFITFISFIVASYLIYKSKLTSTKKKILVTLAFTILLVVIVFSTLEAYFRYVYDVPDGLGFLRVNEKWHQRHTVYNHDFFRDRNFTANREQGTVKIAVLGDSLAFGAGIENVQDRFSNLLEKKLNSQGYKVEVYNLGKPGYDTEAEIEVYNSVKNLNFDIVVWEYFINDIQPKVGSTGSPIITTNRNRAKILEAISRNSYFADYLYWRFSSVYSKTISSLRTADVDQYKDQQRIEDHKKVIGDFISSLRAQNKEIVVIMFPAIALLGQDYPVFTNDIMHEIYRANSVSFVDLYSDLKDQNPKNLRASNFDAHPNEKVHLLAAEKLVELIKPLLTTSF